MKNVGSGNTPPHWFPRDIVEFSNIAFTNINWRQGNDTTSRRCMKYLRDCQANDGTYRLHTAEPTVNQVITFKFDKAYNGATFTYNNRRTPKNEFLKGRMIGTVGEFRLKGVLRKSHRFPYFWPNQSFSVDGEFDEVVLRFPDNQQNWFDIQIIAEPYP
jgi:hypothetical protein